MKTTIGGVLTATMICVSGMIAQTPAAPAPQAAVGTAPSRMFLDVVVTRKGGGAPVAGLAQQDFTILDNGMKQPVTSFKAFDDSNAPVEVIVVIDEVNASYLTVSVERSQIDKFLRANGGKLEYPTALAFFSEIGTQIQPGFSRDGNALSSDLDHQVVALRGIRRSAGLYGAAEQMERSIKTLNQLAAREGTRPGRKIILWISPGWAILTGPHVYISAGQQKLIYSSVIRMSNTLGKAGVTVYSIDPAGAANVGYGTYYYKNFVKGVRSPQQTDFGDLSLQVLATQSGGLVLNTSNDVAGQMRKAIEDTKAYYAMSFDPAQGEPDEYHRIEMKVSEPGLVARTRSGYYAQQ
ncbi:MAG TPA: VWA domain-containing protein [Silvibacterium sp.]|nr:VWA domain-containing protein [Silvibacterium sp.]